MQLSRTHTISFKSEIEVLQLREYVSRLVITSIAYVDSVIFQKSLSRDAERFAIKSCHCADNLNARQFGLLECR